VCVNNRNKCEQWRPYEYYKWSIWGSGWWNIWGKVDNINQEMGDESDEDHPLSDDSDCISDCSDNLTNINKKIIDNSRKLMR